MKKIRIHNRGGQGGVTAASIIVNAALKEGLYGHAIPKFTGERRGAPIEVYVRLDQDDILIRTPIRKPDVIIVMDQSLFEIANVTEGLVEGGFIIANTEKPLDFNARFKLATLNATKLAEKWIDRPIVNTAMLGAFCKATNLVSLDSMLEAVSDRFQEDEEGKNTNLVNHAFALTEVKE